MAHVVERARHGFLAGLVNGDSAVAGNPGVEHANERFARPSRPRGYAAGSRSSSLHLKLADGMAISFPASAGAEP